MTINVLGGAGSATGSLTDGTPLALTVVTLPATADYKYNVFVSVMAKVSITAGTSNDFEFVVQLPGAGAQKAAFTSLGGGGTDFLIHGRTVPVTTGVVANSDDLSAEEFVNGSVAITLKTKSVPVEAGPGAAIVVYLTSYYQAGGGTVPTAVYYLTYSYVGVKVT